MAITITKHMNAKAFYEANKDKAEVTYAWFVSRIGTMYEARGGDSEELFKAGWYYFLDVRKSIFTEMLKRSGAGKAIDQDVAVIDVMANDSYHSK